MSRILTTGGCITACTGADSPPWADTPLGRHPLVRPPWAHTPAPGHTPLSLAHTPAQTPPGRHPPCRHSQQTANASCCNAFLFHYIFTFCTLPNRLGKADLFLIYTCDLLCDSCRGITHTPITIKAEANPQCRQPLSLTFMSPLYNAS